MTQPLRHLWSIGLDCVQMDIFLSRILLCCAKWLGQNQEAVLQVVDMLLSLNHRPVKTGGISEPKNGSIREPWVWVLTGSLCGCREPHCVPWSLNHCLWPAKTSTSLGCTISIRLDCVACHRQAEGLGGVGLPLQSTHLMPEFGGNRSPCCYQRVISTCVA